MWAKVISQRNRRRPKFHVQDQHPEARAPGTGPDGERAGTGEGGERLENGDSPNASDEKDGAMPVSFSLGTMGFLVPEPSRGRKCRTFIVSTEKMYSQRAPFDV